MRPIDDPSSLTPDVRFAEVATILAGGVLGIRDHERASASTDRLDMICGNGYIPVSEYEYQNCSTPDENGLPGTVRPDQATDSEPAARLRVGGYIKK